MSGLILGTVSCAPDPSGGGSKPPEAPSVIVPTYKDYGRDTKDFKDIVYSRPDIEAVVAAFKAVTEEISRGSKSAQQLLEQIRSLEDVYVNLRSMYCFLEVQTSIDASVEFFAEEYKYISQSYPTFVKAVEDMFVAAAKSPHKKYFEDNYFHSSLDEYLDGGIYTDEVVALMAKEAELEGSYSLLSTATVEITYKDKTGTVDELLASVAKIYGEDSTEYLGARTTCIQLYKQKLNQLSKPIYVDLIKVRRQIADELGYSSYATLAYKDMGHEYDPEEMMEFLSDIKKYVYPVYMMTYYEVFGNFFNESTVSELDRVTLINTLYSVYEAMDGDIHGVYSYMLQHGLYNIEAENANRMQGAFTTYIDSNNSPFIFMSTGGYSTDYLTLAHEFGHFTDNYLNFGSSASLDLAEVSSQGLEYLTLLALKDKLKNTEYRYLEYNQLAIAMETLLNQGIIAAAEHYIYSLALEDINEENLNAAVAYAWDTVVGGQTTLTYGDLIMVHTVEYPFYVQSYCSSLTATFEIFFAEAEKKGEGLKIYKELIDRGEEEKGYEEILSDAGLSSPFEEDLLKLLADKIYCYVTGDHYFKEYENAA